jgi:hypothetical protein
MSTATVDFFAAQTTIKNVSRNCRRSLVWRVTPSTPSFAAHVDGQRGSCLDGRSIVFCMPDRNGDPLIVQYNEVLVYADPQAIQAMGGIMGSQVTALPETPCRYPHHVSL